MSDDAPLRVRTRGLRHAHRDPRGAGRNDRNRSVVGRVYLGEQFDLEIRPFRAIFPEQRSARDTVSLRSTENVSLSLGRILLQSFGV